eukprot:CAMPEP_0177506848 /NCGR_PEP_ID=MMETSP0369-20130122/40173_1 /TAXON_ID=447022 ORGANISM="Scrippsiella hangoei-like, Strain SHHI-4" /NCGR_SAMPLE_ID=MMETSP0369 /ASSEMBLY_ACC=CAM_ASM_000364 /LENGTH=118 /DNA_ID=CAMNT_0018984841 /DNA_START=93 /DNA_END=448 /DNA_ORIENTATION=+
MSVFNFSGKLGKSGGAASGDEAGAATVAIDLLRAASERMLDVPLELRLVAMALARRHGGDLIAAVDALSSSGEQGPSHEEAEPIAERGGAPSEDDAARTVNPGRAKGANAAAAPAETP